MTPTDISAISAMQQRLNEQGYGPLLVDGRYGPETRAAYQRYLDETDPTMPTLIPVAARPWYVQPTVLAGLAALVVSGFGLERYGLSADMLRQGLDIIATAVLGLVAIWSGVKGTPPVDRGAVFPGIVRPVGELRDSALPANRPAGEFDNHSH